MLGCVRTFLIRSRLSILVTKITGSISRLKIGVFGGVKIENKFENGNDLVA